MSESNYTYTRSLIPESNFSFTRFADLPKKTDCGNKLPPGFHPNLCDWNANLCANDSYYAQPVLKEDKIYLQFKFINTWEGASSLTVGWRDDAHSAPGDQWYISADILDEDGNVISSSLDTFASEWMVARTEDNVDFQNLIINVLNVPVSEGAFIVRIGYQTPDLSVVYYYSEPFEIINCGSTVLMEGTYINKDFQNNIYTPGETFLGTSNFSHRAVRRYRGVYEMDEIKISKTLNDSNIVTSVTTNDLHNFVLSLMPPYEVDNLKIILQGVELYVNGVLNNDVTGFKKNTERTRMWRPIFNSTIKPKDPNANPAEDCG